MPTRNRALFIGDALKSVLDQSYQNLEIIIQNNNSKDNTEEIIKSFKDSRIKYFKSNKDLSLLDNWSVALNKAKGEYFLRLDDDNILFSTFIEDALKACIGNDFDGITCNSYIVSSNLEIKSLNNFSTAQTVRELNWKELMFLTYEAFTDSNYSLYNIKKLKALLGNQLYKTTLPDRYLDYKICELIRKSKFKFGYSPLPNSVTRFDHIPGFNKNYKYEKFISKDDFEKKVIGNDLHKNFQLHKIITLKTFSDECSENEILEYINSSIINTELKYFYSFFYHLYEAKKNTSSFNELVTYLNDNLNFLKYIIKNLIGIKLDKSITIYFFIVIKNFLFSIKNFIINRKRPEYFFDKAIGDKLILRIKKNEFKNLKSVTKSIDKINYKYE